MTLYAENSEGGSQRMMVLKMALKTTGLLQVQIRPSSPASSSKACIGWGKAEQTVSKPQEIIAELRQVALNLQVC